MLCITCGQHDASVLETRRLFAGAVIRRKRGCICGATFSTYEIDGGIWPTVRKWAIGSRLVALRKAQARRARDQLIVDRLTKGDRATDVGRDFGISVGMVCVIRDRAGLPKKRAPRGRRNWLGL